MACRLHTIFNVSDTVQVPTRPQRPAIVLNTHTKSGPQQLLNSFIDSAFAFKLPAASLPLGWNFHHSFPGSSIRPRLAGTGCTARQGRREDTSYREATLAALAETWHKDSDCSIPRPDVTQYHATFYTAALTAKCSHHTIRPTTTLSIIHSK